MREKITVKIGEIINVTFLSGWRPNPKSREGDDRRE